MDYDTKIKRAKYIDKTCEIRNTLSWADPNQILKAGDIYCGDHYGSNLWLLTSKAADSYFKSWNTFVKLSWGVPVNTHTNLVENVFARDFLSSRNQVLSRYVTFFQSLTTSPCREVRLLARIVASDKNSVTYQNIAHVTNVSEGLSPWDYSKSRISSMLTKSPILEVDQWRVTLIEKLLIERKLKFDSNEDTAAIQTWLDSLCTT